MNLLRAEAYKIISSRVLLALAATGVVLPVLLSGVNASSIAQAKRSGQSGSVTSDLASVGVQEAMVGVAFLAVFAAFSASAEYRVLPAQVGGGSQGVTTALAMPHRGRAFGAKFFSLACFVAPLAALACGACLLVATHFLGSDALPLTPARWLLAARAALYLMLSATQAFALTVILRSALIPVVYLVANSTVLSVGYLLTRVTTYAWYLPDTAGMPLVRTSPDPGQPSVMVGAIVMMAWTAIFSIAAFVAHRRRDM